MGAFEMGKGVDEDIGLDGDTGAEDHIRFDHHILAEHRVMREEDGLRRDHRHTGKHHVVPAGLLPDGLDPRQFGTRVAAHQLGFRASIATARPPRARATSTISVR